MMQDITIVIMSSKVYAKNASQAGLRGLLGIMADLLAGTHAHWECRVLTCGEVNPFRKHDKRLCGRGWQTR